MTLQEVYVSFKIILLEVRTKCDQIGSIHYSTEKHGVTVGNIT